MTVPESITHRCLCCGSEKTIATDEETWVPWGWLEVHCCGVYVLLDPSTGAVRDVTGILERTDIPFHTLSMGPGWLLVGRRDDA